MRSETKAHGRQRTCLGFGATEGRCQEPAGCPHSPYWCRSCNVARMDHISGNLRRIAARLRSGDAGRGEGERDG